MGVGASLMGADKRGRPWVVYTDAEKDILLRYLRLGLSTRAAAINAGVGWATLDKRIKRGEQMLAADLSPRKRAYEADCQAMELAKARHGEHFAMLAAEHNERLLTGAIIRYPGPATTLAMRILETQYPEQYSRNAELLDRLEQAEEVMSVQDRRINTLETAQGGCKECRQEV